MDDIEQKDFVRFVRHMNIGPGKIEHESSNRIEVRFHDASGHPSDKLSRYEIGDWRVKEIPPDSLGAIFCENPDAVLSLIDDQNPAIIELALKEFQGRASLDQMKIVLSPLVETREYDWGQWWKRVGQRLRRYKSIEFDKGERIYVLLDEMKQKDALATISPDSLATYPADSLAELAEAAFNNLTRFKELDRDVLEGIWDRLCKILKETEPQNRHTAALLALGDMVTEIIPSHQDWTLIITSWLDDAEANLIGTRNARIRARALKTLSKIKWSRKRETICSYIIQEESGEKNRRTASTLLWDICARNPEEYFSGLLDFVRNFQISSNNPLEFIKSRSERVLDASTEFLGTIQYFNEMKAFCVGSGQLLTSLHLKASRSPFDYKTTLTVLKLWMTWKDKAEKMLLPNDRWVIWYSCLPLLKSCSEVASKEFFKEHCDIAEWSKKLMANIVNQANSGNLESANDLYTTITFMKSSSEVQEEISSLFQNGAFINDKSQEWALSITVNDRSDTQVTHGPKELAGEQLAELAYHPRERRISKEVANLLLLTKEREDLLAEASDAFEELVRLYEPVRLESARNMGVFLNLLKDNLESLRALMALEYIGTPGSIEKYNPNEHQLIEELSPKPIYVQIVLCGIRRREKGGPPEVLRKAVVKPATGGQP